MNALVKQGFDRGLISLGFYPAQLSENGKTLKVADPKTDRELHFELNDYKFKVVDAKDFKELPVEISDVVKKDSREWFEEIKVAYPVEEERPINRDPFLLGIKDGKAYLISAWNNDVWDR